MFSRNEAKQKKDRQTWSIQHTSDFIGINCIHGIVATELRHVYALVCHVGSHERPKCRP